MIIYSSLIVVFILLIIVTYVMIFKYLQKKSKLNEKILIEDILKKIYNDTENNKKTDFVSLEKFFKKRKNNLQKILNELQRGELIIFEDYKISLTTKGFEYASNIVRTHRLYETYLAGVTNIKESKWHKNAEKMEHLLKSEEIDFIDAELGFPRYDPHGDPIPFYKKELPSVSSLNLNSTFENKFYKIIHIEDEPPDIYESLISMGLKPGIIIKVINADDESRKIEFEEKILELKKELFNYINVSEISEEFYNRHHLRSLSNLKIGESAVVKEISSDCMGKQRRRLMDFGILPGTKIWVEMESPSGNLRAYNIRGAIIALRKQQTNLIFIE